MHKIRLKRIIYVILVSACRSRSIRPANTSTKWTTPELLPTAAKWTMLSKGVGGALSDFDGSMPSQSNDRLSTKSIGRIRTTVTLAPRGLYIPYWLSLKRESKGIFISKRWKIMKNVKSNNKILPQLRILRSLMINSGGSDVFYCLGKQILNWSHAIRFYITRISLL